MQLQQQMAKEQGDVAEYEAFVVRQRKINERKKADLAALLATSDDEFKESANRVKTLVDNWTKG